MNLQTLILGTFALGYVLLGLLLLGAVRWVYLKVAQEKLHLGELRRQIALERADSVGFRRHG